MFIRIASIFAGQRAAVVLGAIAVTVAMGISISLLFSVGSRHSEWHEAFLTSRYQVSSIHELETKIASLGAISPQGQAILKNLDMPDHGRTEATLASVDLFERVFTRQELCLAQAVYFEARGEPLIGQVAIAEVVLNRVVSSRYPDTACEVVFQNQHLKNRCQFSFACDGKSDRPKDIRAWEQSLKVVALVMAGERSGVARSATHYHASYVAPRWRTALDKVGEVGRHIFYRRGVI
ncbi:cell wall hydrolase [Sneathiella glossodoripedis]|uniref:cell wall hydrolase n=1 Tax=Sneathiella glossodoripedis TaxID=418853 RepID=UPI0004700CFD|nr:cell wall hydrolase [Sneathiella glossodoripedis]